MLKSDISAEESYKEDMPNLAVPKFHLIQQSDENGYQVNQKPSRLSWFASLCNCFRTMDLNYSGRRANFLLDAQNVADYGKNTLVLDLDETLVHSSFSPMEADITLDIMVDRQKFKIYVLKRPGLEEFLQKCCDLFEVVIFTASLSVYADPLLNILDPHGRVSFRLFRESCSYANSTYIKDLSKLGRDLKKVVIVDNSPTSYSYQPDNAIPIKTWMDDKSDKCLYELWDVLNVIANVEDIPTVLAEVKKKRMDLNAEVVGKVVESIKNRGEFNSPVNAEAKKFRFDE